jgi:hypothetical protein
MVAKEFRNIHHFGGAQAHSLRTVDQLNVKLESLLDLEEYQLEGGNKKEAVKTRKQINRVKLELEKREISG